MSDAAVGAATPDSIGGARRGRRSGVVAGSSGGRRVHRHRPRPRSVHLQRRSFWQDEGFTWSTVDRSFPALLSVMLHHEGYQILHALIEWPTNRISSTVAALRMPSVLVVRGGSRGLARRAATVRRADGPDRRVPLRDQRRRPLRTRKRRAATCSQRCSAYAGALLAQYVLAPRRWSRAGWITFSVLTIYAHGFAVLAIAAQILALWFLPAARRRELHWIRDGALIALLASPALIAPIYQINSGEIAFISRPGFTPIGVFVRFISGRTWTAVPPYAIGADRRRSCGDGRVAQEPPLRRRVPLRVACSSGSSSPPSSSWASHTSDRSGSIATRCGAWARWSSCARSA